MKLEQIVYALEIARCGSISKAAKNLLLTQPNLSSSIKNLEDDIGFKIFQRLPRGVSVTTKGTQFLEYAESICRDVENINAIGSNSNSLTPINFSLSTQSFSYIMDNFLALHSNYNSNITNFKIKHSHYFEVLDDVVRKQADIGIISISNEHMDLWNKLFKSKNIEFNPITSGKLHGYILDSHPLFNKEKLVIEDLFEYPLVTCNHDDYNALYSNDFYKNKLSFKNNILVSDYGALIYTMESVNAATIILKLENSYTKLYFDSSHKGRYVNIDILPEITLGWIKLIDSPISSIASEFIDLIAK
ncbi:LysR family transcriptional regulator [Paraclostridium bifermentans]|jgi:DNA-binding transcriptional LysR family regulator|uniref:LysR family transcriptional regulator n=1 Tax=Paraclostridium bifermentans TaxID=1490 RepID=UPI0011DCD90B|nr:LysR family transcriptional regulator [Paraclostridium bifermentans]MBS5954080.1 LysR family transcriptional regulator [Paraclostridium bifermentans]MBS6508853.1 LysR family transcriptional regulator [Paraclostridium bifermentans]MBU5287210.1 LysR family transcriptional regulator [Paraclostridium bifermentans]MDU3337358.1 LysR family transcriptional regulator [Paraclostridium bifermentans]MDU3803325.1 LysR family transcriptional regulator [Paraclostridium bifermentans]